MNSDVPSQRSLGEANAVPIPNPGAVTVGPDASTAVMYAVLLGRARKTQLMAAAAGGPHRWSDEAELPLKRDQVWNLEQLQAGWRYLNRQADAAMGKPL